MFQAKVVGARETFFGCRILTHHLKLLYCRQQAHQTESTPGCKRPIHGIEIYLFVCLPVATSELGLFKCYTQLYFSMSTGVIWRLKKNWLESSLPSKPRFGRFGLPMYFHTSFFTMPKSKSFSTYCAVASVIYLPNPVVCVLQSVI